MTAKMRKVLLALMVAVILAGPAVTVRAQSGGGGGGGWGGGGGPVGSCGDDPLCGIDPMNLLNCNNSIDWFLSWLFGITCVPY